MIIRAVRGSGHAPIFGAESQRFLLRILLVVGQLERAHFGRSRRVVFPQRMSFPRRRHQNAVPGAGALENRIPNMSQTSRSYQFAAGQRSVMVSMRRLILVECYFDADIFVAVKRKEVIHDGEVALPAARRGDARVRSSIAVRS